MKNKAETAFLSLSLLEQFPEVQSNRLNFKFPGRGQKAVEVAPLAEALEFAFLLPGRNAAKVRKEAAKLLVRYFGGDLSLVDEIFQRNCVQAALAQIPEEERTAEQQTARLFGGSVESTTAQPTLAPALSIFLLLFDDNTWPAPFAAPPADEAHLERIDYVFAWGEQLVVSHSTVLSAAPGHRWPSDHMAVLSDVSFRIAARRRVPPCRPARARSDMRFARLLPREETA